MADTTASEPVAKTANLAMALVDEMERVVVLRERWRRVAVETGTEAAMAPNAALMTAAIDLAKKGLGENDVMASLLAHAKLKEFVDEEGLADG